MAVALPIDFGVFPTPASAFADFIAAITDVDRRAESAVKQAAKAMDEAEGKLRVTISGLEATLDLADKAVAVGVPLDTDRIIEAAEWAEKEIRREDQQVQKIVGRIEKLLRKHSPQFARRIAPLIERFGAVSEWYQAELRDARWRVMALRAEQHRGERGPVFSEPEEIERYLSRRGG